MRNLLLFKSIPYYFSLSFTSAWVDYCRFIQYFDVPDVLTVLFMLNWPEGISVIFPSSDWMIFLKCTSTEAFYILPIVEEL